MAQERKKFKEATEKHIENIMKVYDTQEAQDYLFSTPTNGSDPTDYQNWAKHIKISSERNNQAIKDSYK